MARLLVDGNVVEHWINQERVMVYTLDTPEWHRLVASAGSGRRQDLGRLPAGRLALAGQGIAFRDIKVRSQ